MDGKWVYTLLVEVILEAGIQVVETYVACHQNTFAHYIETRPRMNLCLAAEINPGTRISKW